MADGDFNLATLWVPVVPETSQVGPKIEEAGDEAKRRWTDKVKDFGHVISDDLEKVSSKAKDTFGGLGTHISDVFSRAGRDSGDKFGTELGRSSGKVKDLGHQFGEAFGSELGQAVGGALRDKFPIVDQLATSFKGVGAAIDHIKQADLGGALGDASNVLHGLEPIAKSFGLDISSWPDSLQKIAGPAQNVANTLATTKTNVAGVQSLFGDFKKDAPGIAGSFAMIADAAGPVAALMGTIVELWPQIKANMSYDDHKTPSGGVDWWKLGVGNAAGGWLENQYNQLIHGHPTPTRPGAPSPPSGPLPPDMVMGGAAGLGGPPMDLFSGGPAVGGAGGSDYSGMFGGGSSPAPAPAPVAAAPMPSSFAGSMPSSFSSPADLHAAGSRVANLFAVAQSLVGTPYSMPLRNDCSGMVSKLATAALGLPAQASFSTANEGQWLMSHGFQPGTGGPNDLNIGWHQGGPGGGHTAATLPGGVNAESGGSVGSFALGGPVGAFSSQFENHAYLPMGAGGGMGGAGALGIPTGAQHDPLYVMQAGGGDDGSGGGAGGAGGAGGQGNSQAEQLGKGLVNGLTQELGLDGSVFKGFGGASNPLQFGSVKAGMGLLNFGLGLAQHSQGAGGLGGVGGGGGIPGMGMIPTGPGGGAQNVSGGDTTNIYHGPVGGFTVNGAAPADPAGWKNAANSVAAAPDRYPSLGNVPNAGAGLNAG